MAAPVFLNKTVLALFAVAQEECCRGGIFGDKAISLHRNKVDLCPVAELQNLPYFPGDNVHVQLSVFVCYRRKLNLSLSAQHIDLSSSLIP